MVPIRFAARSPVYYHYYQHYRLYDCANNVGGFTRSLTYHTHNKGRSTRLKVRIADASVSFHSLCRSHAKLSSANLNKSKNTKVVDMSQNGSDNRFKFYKVVLTGGPCGGKTTGQTRLSTFFENLGWKVYRAPESALLYLSGGVIFQDLKRDETFTLQEDIVKTMITVEDTFHHLAEKRTTNVLLICDRGTMDGSAYLPREDWEKIKEKNSWNEVDLRDNRYNQVIHMVSAARGAEAFYTIVGHKTRKEDFDGARQLDTITADAWVGHPYYDVIDNSTDFEGKISRMIAAVCTRVGIDLGDRLAPNSVKRKFLVSNMKDEAHFPHYQEFHVVHDYLVTPSRKMQARLRRRGQNGSWTYTHTIRRPEINDQSVELRMPISEKDYEILMAQRDDQHYTVFKIRRCFLWNNQYFQLDMYQDPAPPGCKGLMLLETFTTLKDLPELPHFLQVEREVTNDPKYSMFNLSQKGIYSSSCEEASPSSQTQAGDVYDDMQQKDSLESK
ncbi:trpl translocation defect protein 14 [Plakobranchus ocellatus]|uniref:Trpl translocation defect protein 14 n=1 Tax=Plakobranchus ocellatus TaxID=259542 RepID=A0AAV4DGT1_9GAST|nr:trpl translocation defect protein 14 [Plakobranchus ocellatus]